MTHKKPAFSLVEMIVVLTLATLLIGMTAPHFRGFFSARELQNAVTFIENSFEDTYSRARSEQQTTGAYNQIIGIEIKSNTIIQFTCPYDPVDISTGCKEASNDEELLWENRPIGESLNVKLTPSPLKFYLTPPHGDIIDPTPQAFYGDTRELKITHESGDEEILIFHKLSGLVEKK